MLLLSAIAQAAERYVSLSGSHLPPFTSWAEAATNIQAAIDAANEGDTIWVTNGVYNSGGKIMAGDLVNRVALDKAVTVQSVNGPAVTVIEGQRDFETSTGALATRAAWLTNGAVLSGFTLRAGQTRASGDTISLRNGGGVWCVSTNAVVTNSLIVGNAAATLGGGAFRGTLRNCLLKENGAGSGGGAAEAILINCAVIGNDASLQGGGAFTGMLTNCTVSGNAAGTEGGGTRTASAYNTIIWNNRAPNGSNYLAGNFAFSCTSPLPPGAGNTATNPMLLADGQHLASESPVRTAGNPTFASGLDIDGQPWADPPSLGCDQWMPEPMILAQPQLSLDGWGSLRLSMLAAGAEPLSYAWFKNGEPLIPDGRQHGFDTGSLKLLGIVPQDAGEYSVVVSNGFGVVTSMVAQVTIHCADAAASSPTPPYAGWSTAATTIQEAIDAASAGAVVLVTNGVYANGGRIMAGDLMNRVAVDKPLLVTSVNGPLTTIIVGQKDAATNGPTAVRAVWLTQGAVLSGFTVRNGATRSSGDQVTLLSGGGLWSVSTNALATDCLILDNAAFFGGGAFRVSLERCTVQNNFAQLDGGGVCSNLVQNSRIFTNTAVQNGGGAHGARITASAISGNVAGTGGGAHRSELTHVTVVKNRGRVTGGGTTGCAHTNSIIWLNFVGSSLNNYSSPAGFRSSCSTALPPLGGNISLDPLLLADDIHLATNSPCRGAGLAITAGPDIDGQPWNAPPSIGCDEWSPEPIAAPPTIHFDAWRRARISAIAAGEAPFAYRWLKDGGELAGGGSAGGVNSPELHLSPIGFTDAGDYRFVLSNAFGISTSQVVQLTIRCVDVNNPTPTPPYDSWTSAANVIQDAVDLAGAGDLILVNNGIYARGGRVMAGDLTNRVAVDKAVALMSVSGPSATIIQGEWDVTSTNGPGAVRGVWLGDEAAIFGFTVRGGATRGLVGDVINLQTGGGVWCNSTNARVVGCIIRGGAAGATGGGAFGGVFRGTLISSLIHDNQVAGAGFSSMINCTVTGNGLSGSGGGLVAAITNLIHNSIIWGNGTSSPGGTAAQHFGGTFSYSCSQPLPAGVGNLSVDPMLTESGLRLRPGSPCANAGSAALAAGFDVDGQNWADQPSMGCDEWQPELAVPQPAIVAAGDGRIRLKIAAAGLAPSGYVWFKDELPVTNDARISGAQTEELVITDFGPTDVGTYSVVVTNSLGNNSSPAVNIRARFVDPANTAPQAPFSSWSTAATTIQDAVDAAGIGELVLVADGIHASGSRVATGDLGNRIVLSKSVTVTSRFGPTNAVIEGQKDLVGPNGNGNGALRAVWLDNWTGLSGFTIRGGATRTSGTLISHQSGGGIAGLSPNAVVSGCLIVSNAANHLGGGAYGVRLTDCVVAGNTAAFYGGGVSDGVLDRCRVQDNSAVVGGVYRSTIRNSLVVRNTGTVSGGTMGVVMFHCVIVENQGGGLGSSDQAYNSIIWGNTPANYNLSPRMHHSCTFPMPPAFFGTNNISADPQLLDDFELAAGSPCRSAGSADFSSGTDLDGDNWLLPPSIGAQEYVDGPRTGPLSVSIETSQPNVLVNRFLTLAGRINGRASGLEWNLGDGLVVTNTSYFTTHAWSSPGTYPVTLTVYNDDHPGGQAATLPVEVLSLETPALSGNWHGPGTFRLEFVSQFGASNTVQFATNLNPPVIWHPLHNLTSTGGVVQIFDTTATNSTRFYRLQIR